MSYYSGGIIANMTSQIGHTDIYHLSKPYMSNFYNRILLSNVSKALEKSTKMHPVAILLFQLSCFIFKTSKIDMEVLRDLCKSY